MDKELINNTNNYIIEQSKYFIKYLEQVSEPEVISFIHEISKFAHVYIFSGVIRNFFLEFNEKDKYIAAICAAPSVLARLGILAGKNAACFPSVEDELIKGGAVLSRDKVVVDGTIITSRGAGTALDFSLKLIEVLKGIEEAEKISETIVYK